MQHPVELLELSPQATKLVGASTPAPLKMMAASGLVPLGPSDLVSVLYFLSYQEDETLSQKAQASLIKLPDNILPDTLAAIKNCNLLDGIAKIVFSRSEAIEKIILNAATGDETVEWLTIKINKENLLEIIAANENRMLRHPKIIEALYMNKAARMSTVDRSIELAVRNGLELNGIPSFQEAKKAIEGELIFEASPEPSPDDILFNDTLDDDQANQIIEEDVSSVFDARERSKEEKGKEATSQAKDQVHSMEVSMSKLTISQKIRIAMLGNASQRAVLVRDSNKLVIMAVLKSPAVNDSEVMRFSRAKSLPEDAIRYVANRREWTKHYQVKVNLVGNPRTPIQDALRFLSHLRANDVKSLETSREIPAVIKNAAKELRKKRGR